MTRYMHLPSDEVRKPRILLEDEVPEKPEAEPEENDTADQERGTDSHAREKQRRSHVKFSLKAVLWVVFLVILFTVVMLFCFLPGFHIQNIEISGNEKVTTEEILSILDIHKDEHLISHIGGSLKSIVTMHYGNLEEKLKSERSYIQNVSIVPSFPGNVYITITERKKVAYVAIPDGYAVIAEDGAVLEICQGDVPEGVPELRGLPVRSAQLGKPLDMTSDEGYEISLSILGAILGADSIDKTEDDTFDFLANIVCIRYCENMTSFIEVKIPNREKTVTVKVGSMTTISDDMQWLRYAIVSGYFEEKTGELLDMTGNNYILR